MGRGVVRDPPARLNTDRHVYTRDVHFVFQKTLVPAANDSKSQ